MSLTEHIHLTSRFQRAIRIDHDISDPKAIDGFCCSASSANILSSMVDHISETSQCAFTWTGPYGSGKSSLVVFLCALLSQDKQLQRRAFASLERGVASKIKKHFSGLNWQVIPVVGRRENPVNVIGEVIESQHIDKLKPNQTWTESRAISTLKKLIDRNSRDNIGTILFVDEMGKFLESAADDLTDVYLFQQLAEIACRSRGRFILIGVLHQAFGEYANKLNQIARDEWGKIQGRFVDLTFRIAVDEQIHMLGRAINSDHLFKIPSKTSKVIARAVANNRKLDYEELAVGLEHCWPLHPAVACLLGPLSQSRFGQNQRSVFSFLGSQEPNGFRDFVHSTSGKKLYELYRLWDYLRSNLEPSIYASHDGHRWALAAESVSRCEAKGSNGVEVKLLKTIAVLDFFRNRSGLVGSFEVLCACMLGNSKTAVRKALTRSQAQSLIVYRKFIDGYSIFAGSDFDIDEAVATARNELSKVDFQELKTLAGIQPILAKRHYHETGALRWCDVVFAPLTDITNQVTSYKQTANSAGLFLVAVPTHRESSVVVEKICKQAAKNVKNKYVVVGLSKHSWKVADLYEELIALQRVCDERPELASDEVARREIQSRLASLQANLVVELNRTIDSAVWFLKHHKPKNLTQSDLSILASKLADKKFSQSPRIHVEILNRNKPSTNAIAAQNALLRRMVLNNGEERLSIKGYPPEFGYFKSLLEQTGIYRNSNGQWNFHAPSDRGHYKEFRIGSIWNAVLDCLKSSPNNMVELSGIYDVWRKPPFGVKEGLMPILIVAFILSRRNQIAFYREGVFQVDIGNIDVEFLAKHPESTSIRLIEPTQESTLLLSRLAEIALEFNGNFEVNERTPINVARGLVAIFVNLPQWTIRTNTLSLNANKIRTLFKQANDPNRFLFDDLQNSMIEENHDGSIELDDFVEALRGGIAELVEAYPKMLYRLRDNLLRELRVQNLTHNSFRALRERASNVMQLTGDFRLEAFVGRLAQIKNSIPDIEGLASLAVNKLPSLWVDSDIDMANLELSQLARKFIQIETFANVKGRVNKRQAMAIILSSDSKSDPLVKEFSVANTDYDDVNELVGRLTQALNGDSKIDDNVILAALAKVSLDYMDIKSDVT